MASFVSSKGGTECHRQEAQCPPFPQAMYHVSLQSRSSRCYGGFFVEDVGYFCFGSSGVSGSDVVLGGARPPRRFDFWHLKVVWPSYEAAAVGKRGRLVWFAGTLFRRRELHPSLIDSPFVCLEQTKVHPISEPKGCSCDVQPGFVCAAYHTWIPQRHALLFQTGFRRGDKGHEGEAKSRQS